VPPKTLGGRDFGGQTFDFGPDFLGIGEFWSTFFGIFGKLWGRATTSPNLVGLRSKTKKLRTWVHYGPLCPQCVGCACPKPQNRSRSDNTPQHTNSRPSLSKHMPTKMHRYFEECDKILRTQIFSGRIATKGTLIFLRLNRHAADRVKVKEISSQCTSVIAIGVECWRDRVLIIST